MAVAGINEVTTSGDIPMDHTDETPLIRELENEERFFAHMTLDPKTAGLINKVECILEKWDRDNRGPAKKFAFQGSHGNGKSMAVEALSTEWKMPLLEVNSGIFQESYPDGRNRYFRRVFEYASQRGGVILHIDGRVFSELFAEIDPFLEVLDQANGHFVVIVESRGHFWDIASIAGHFDVVVPFWGPTQRDLEIYIERRLEGRQVTPEQAEYFARGLIGQSFRRVSQVVSYADSQSPGITNESILSWDIRAALSWLSRGADPEEL